MEPTPISALEQVLRGVSRIGLDTPLLIYFVEAHPRYDALVVPIFERIERGMLVGCTSVITLTEVLVHPLRQGRGDLAQQYRRLLLNSANFEVVAISPAIAEYAAELRARHNFRTPDAIQIATAIMSRCDVFLTNDATLQRIDEMKVLTLDSLI